MTSYIYPTIAHLEQESIFSNHQIDENDSDYLEAIRIWEQVAEAKYDDIKGYALVMLLGGRAAQKACAKLEIQNIDSLFKDGNLNLSTGYSDLDAKQIQDAYQPLLTNRFSNFISIRDTKSYLNSEQDEFEAANYFSRKWIVATQVQALFWYKEFLHDVIKRGISFRDDKPIADKAVNTSAIKNENSYNVCYESAINQYKGRNNFIPTTAKELLAFMRHNDIINPKNNKRFEITFDDAKEEITVGGSTPKAISKAMRAIKGLLNKALAANNKQAKSVVNNI